MLMRLLLNALVTHHIPASVCSGALVSQALFRLALESLAHPIA